MEEWFAEDGLSVALLLHPGIEIAAHRGKPLGLFRIGGEVVEFVGVVGEVVEFFSGPYGKALHRGGGGSIVFSGGEPGFPIGEAAGA